MSRSPRGAVGFFAISALLGGCGAGLPRQNLSSSAYPAFPAVHALRGRWQIVASPNEGAKLGNVFYAAADLSPTDAWAVGAWPARSQYLTDTLAAHWDGAKWTIANTPRNKHTAELVSIAAVASNAVWAAGYAENPSCICGSPIVDYWNGFAWRRLKTPNAGIASFLSGISAVSTADIWAVGDDWPNQGTSVPLILHWNGTRWTATSFAAYQQAELYSVYAPSSRDAWAFGYYLYGGTLVLHWDGASWTQARFRTAPRKSSARRAPPRTTFGPRVTIIASPTAIRKRGCFTGTGRNGAASASQVSAPPPSFRASRRLHATTSGSQVMAKSIRRGKTTSRT